MRPAFKDMIQSFLLALLVTFTAPLSGAVLFDRVLFKIGEASFTQREMEIYLLVRNLQFDRKEPIANEQNWSSTLQNFKNAMLVYEESKKLHLNIEQAGLDKQVATIKNAILNDKSLTELSDRLGVDEKDIELTLLVSARVEKAKHVQKENLSETLGIPPAKKVSALDKKHFVRFFDDAETYRLIQPKAFLLRKSATKS